jgi:hypothetical protein
VRFIETSVFTRRVTKLLSDDAYRSLQLALLLRPDQGSVIRGTGGLRKLRWNLAGTGKRGGLRLLYFWDKLEDTIYFLFLYTKSDRDDLSPQQLRTLSRLIREELT